MRKSRFIVLFFLFGFIGGRSQMLAISDTDAAVEVDAVSDSASVARDFSLSEAVVTGARYETDIRHLPMTVSVVSHRVLEESRESSILPVLNAYVPGFFSTSISVANNLSVDCDCDSSPEEPKMGDIGILASLDPVALDKACTDLVRSSKDHGKIHLVERIDSRKGMHTLEYAEQLGMGSHMYGTIPIAASFAAKGVREEGVPMYVCGGGTIPLLMTWLNHGMSYGAATSFMLTGPATKITNLGAVKIVLGMRHFLYYLLFVMLYALLCGGVAELIVNEN